MFKLEVQQKISRFILLGDRDYNLKEELQSEPESESKKEYGEYGLKFQIKENSSRHFIAPRGKFNSDYE